MKKFLIATALTFGAFAAISQTMNNMNTDTSLASLQELELTQQWDKVFPKRDKVNHSKVTFVNRYYGRQCCNFGVEVAS